MPRKNTLKTYLENSYYHIYNRGVDGREIFIDEQDCIMFLRYLKLYLSSPKILKKEELLTPKMLYKIFNMNLSSEIDLLSFSLMPNHIHLQIKQHTKNGIEKLTRRIFSSYVRFFNQKYKRLGPLFESAYKAILITTDEQHLYLSSYIHRNPMKLKQQKFDFIQFSSYPYYLKSKQADWVKPEEILSYFKRAKNITKGDLLSYQSFVEDFREDPKEILAEKILEAS